MEFFTGSQCKIVIISVILWICLMSSNNAAGRLDSSNKGARGHGSHQAMNQKVKVKEGGLQDFGGEEDPDNQLKRESFIRNKEHIEEHMRGSARFDPDSVTPDELDFHFFKIHDTNGDDKLDGLELLSAIAHGLDEQYDKVEEADLEDDVKKRKIRALNNRSWIAVDRILREDDKDKDGYLTYPEYKNSRRASKVLSGETNS